MERGLETAPLLMETLTLKKRRGRPPKDTRKPVEPRENTNMVILANVFIPGELPFEVKYEVPDFRAQSYGQTRTPEGVRNIIRNALVEKYGNRVK